MSERETLDLQSFLFRGLHPSVFLGTASDRYTGWLGQIYTEERYSDKITRRKKTVGKMSFVEEILPVDSVEEYFQHFRVLELDFTFYRLLLEEDGRPTPNYHVLQKYQQHLKEGDNVILKVPQVICAQKLWRGGKFVENNTYLDQDIFNRQFYDPAVTILGSFLTGLIFEQEYQRKKDRSSPKELAAGLDLFFEEIPKDTRYHLELRTEPYLSAPVFEVMEKHGVGQVLSHWTWLPSLSKQFAQAGRRFFNSGGQSIIRLMTPRGARYEEAYAQAHPFNKLVPSMLQQSMVEETAELMWEAIDNHIRINIIVNNRAGGNAPLVGQQIGLRFLERGETHP
ncbi:MAG: DUF72 domain-containing protein [Deltaproteobacteria bacterium]|nr:MAG: DUF72 domain-containing protein [Deltaproteobacteria bacterium]